MSLVIITGASRGFGKSIALEMGAKLPGEKWDFVLTSTKAADSELVAQEVTTKYGPRDIKTIAIDFADMQNLEKNIHALLALASKEKYERVILINNHGSLGQLAVTADLAGHVDTIQREINLNLTSTFALVSLALKQFPNTRVARLDLVNISSLAAVVPFRGWSTYCVVKAARDMLHSVVALENASVTPHVFTLNYAPGPLDTDMQAVIRETDPIQSQRETYTKMKDEGTLLKPEDSARKMIDVLMQQEYKSGAHLDYYDL